MARSRKFNLLEPGQLIIEDRGLAEHCFSVHVATYLLLLYLRGSL